MFIFTTATESHPPVSSTKIWSWSD